MKKFQNWLKIREGFGINYDELPNFMRPNSYDVSRINQDKQNVDLIYQSKAINFDPQDRPQDFICIKKVNSVQTLHIPAKLVLPSFRASILYGMKMCKPKNSFSAPVRQLVKQIAEINDQLKLIRNKDVRKDIQILIYQYYQYVLEKCPNPDWKVISEYINAKLEGQIKKPYTIRKLQNIIKAIKLDQTRSQVEAQRNALQAEYDTVRANFDSEPNLFNIIQRVFLKKIKFPITQEDIILQTQFVNLAVDNYKKLRPNYTYDYVVYPQSRSNLNQIIAERFATLYGAIPIKGFEKLAVPEIDVTSFMRNNPEMPPEERTKIMQDLKKRLASSSGQIKNIHHIHRPFVRNWQMAADLKKNVRPTDEISGLQNRKILLIDDNVASSGTFQSIHHLLLKQSPKLIHIYTPLLVNLSYS